MHWSDIDKCKMSSFFVAVHDQSRYQAAGRSGTFVGNPTCNTLVYEDFDEYQHRYTLKQVQVGLDDRHRDPCHEQFNSISKDFIASLDKETVSKLQKLQSKLINSFQKWWSMVAHKTHNNFFKHHNFYCFILIFFYFLIASLNFESDFFKFYFQFDDLENIFKEFH